MAEIEVEVEVEEKKEEGVWMSCRSNSGCEGKRAKVVFRRHNPLEKGGGTSFRYRCLTCNHAWHITV